MYSEKLISEGILTEDQVKNTADEHIMWLTEELKNVDNYTPDVCIKIY